MKKIILLVLIIIVAAINAFAQTQSYRLKFQYRISSNKLVKLNSKGYHIVDTNKVQYRFCPQLNEPFKCLINNKDGELSIDPWAITDSRTNSYLKNPVTDPCYGQDSVINANTPNILKIVNLKRSKVGNPTRKICLHYQTIIVGVNIIGLKVRPQVKDYNDSTYSANALTGNFNLGLSGGYSFGWTQFTHRSSNSYSVTPGISLGFSSASLSKEPLKKKVTTTYSLNNFILSPSASVTIARNDIGLIFTYGHDIMFGRHSDAWAYQGKGFFGLGIAAGLKL